MSDTVNAPETPAYVHATPGRVMSTLAYVMLASEKWPVYVHTARNYTVYNSADLPTDPGDTIHASAHLQPVGEWHGLAYGNGESNTWGNAVRYLDDRIRPETHTDYDLDTEYHDGSRSVTGAWDEYFVMVAGPDGQNLCQWGDYCGDTVTRSNYRSLLLDNPDTFVEVSYGYGGHGLAIPLFVPVPEAGTYEHGVPANEPHYDREVAEELANTLLGLAEDYPLYDESDHSGLESELAMEAVTGDWHREEILDGVATAVARQTMEKLGGEVSDELVLVLRDVLDKSDKIRGRYQDDEDTGYHTLYTLYLEHQNNEGNVLFEGATVSNVVFTHAEEAFESIAHYFTTGVYR